MLNNITDRDGRWYYYSALAHLGKGEEATALEDAKRALDSDPDNMQYQLLYQRMQAVEAGMQEEERSIRGRHLQHIVQAVLRGLHSACVQIYVCLCAVAMVQAAIIRVEVYK